MGYDLAHNPKDLCQTDNWQWYYKESLLQWLYKQSSFKFYKFLYCKIVSLLEPYSSYLSNLLSDDFCASRSTVDTLLCILDPLLYARRPEVLVKFESPQEITLALNPSFLPVFGTSQPVEQLLQCWYFLLHP